MGRVGFGVQSDPPHFPNRQHHSTQQVIRKVDIRGGNYDHFGLAIFRGGVAGNKAAVLHANGLRNGSGRGL
jgi:hypothetical protein